MVLGDDRTDTTVTLVVPLTAARPENTSLWDRRSLGATQNACLSPRFQTKECVGLPDLYTGIEMIEYVIVFKYSVTTVVKVHSDLSRRVR